MPLSSPPAWKLLRDEGRTSADELLEFCEVRLPPVDLEYVARRLDVRLRYVHGISFAGKIESTEEEAQIWVNAGDSELRQRFTIAHELGHLMLHELGTSFRDSHRFNGNWRETQANRFAANLLMPVWMIDLALATTRGSTSRLAHLFEVSEQAMHFRLVNTGRY